jgi:beta-phosphoglucomutase
MAFRAGIFDLDGVIVDTVPIHFKAWKKMFEEYGKSFNFDDYKKKVDGIPRIDGCRAILTDSTDDEIKTASNRKQEYYLEYLDKQGVKTYETTISLVKSLLENRIKTAVISSSKNLSMILDKTLTRGLFQVVISGNDITVGKPNPQVFLLAAKGLKVLPEECIVFEDATLGVEAAKRAGMRCVGINRDNRAELFKKADIVVSDLGELDFSKILGLF